MKKEKGERDRVQGYPPQSFLPVPQLDIAYPVPRPISPTNFDNRVPQTFRDFVHSFASLPSLKPSSAIKFPTF